MNIFQKLFGVRKKAAPGFPGTASLYLGGQVMIYPDKKNEYVKKGYMYNDIVYSIIGLITNKVKVPQWGWYTVQDEKAYHSYLALGKAMSTKNYQQFGEDEAAETAKDYKTLMGLRSKALTPYTANARLNELLKYPNESQTWSDLMEETAGFKLITGDKYKLAELAEGGLNRGLPLSIDNMPSQHMIIRATNTIPMREAGYQLNMGTIIDYTKEEILHEKYYNPEWGATGKQLYGLSPIQAAWRRIQRSNEGVVQGLAQFQNGGADSILTPDSTDMEYIRYLNTLTKEQLGAQKETIETIINGGSRRAGSIGILNSPWKTTRIRLSPVDLNIIEAEQWDMRMLCNVWGVPSQLMNDPENKIQANASSGERALTTRCALPLLISERDSLNRKFQTHWGLKGKPIICDFDMTVFSELEETKASQVTWLKEAYWFTPNQKLQIMGEPVSDDPNMDKIYMPSSLKPIEDLNMGAGDIDEDVANLEREGLI